MSVYYPQAAVSMTILWEPFNIKDKPNLNEGHALIVQPKTIDVTINNYKEADTCKFTLDYKNFPFEPRTIRNIRVVVSMTNQKRLYDETFRPDRLSPTDLSLLSEAARTAFLKKLQENTVFIGYADESEINFNDDNQEVNIECRDLTSLMIDRPFPAKILSLDRDLFTMIREILDSNDETKPLKMDIRPAELADNPPVIAKASPDIAESKKSIKETDTVWDVITDLCNRAALVAYIELDKLVITKPRLLFSNATRSAFVWGRNLKSLSFKRKLARDKGINIELRSLSIGDKAPIVVKYPEEKLDSAGNKGKAQTHKKIVNGELKEEVAPYHVFFLPDIKSREVLLERAEDIWNEMARQEIEGSLTTMDMHLCSKDGETNFNTLEMKMGTPIEIHIEQVDIETLSTLKARGAQEMKNYLISRCYKPQVADALAHSFDLMKTLSTPFYTKQVVFRLGTQGFNTDVDFINFIQVDPALIGGEATGKVE